MLEPSKRLFKPQEVYATLRKIPSDDLLTLGLNDEYARPEWMVLTVLPVPPPAVCSPTKTVQRTCAY